MNVSLEELCASKGLKMTGQRRTILKVLADAGDHPSVEDILDRAKAIDSSISMATVYRTLNLLDELGMVIKHDFKENFARFDMRMDHHHHLIDIESGDVIEFQNDEIEEMKRQIALSLGYDLVECRLELYGRKIKAAE
jgi:Fur family ferric uptake transcriptional regulator